MSGSKWPGPDNTPKSPAAFQRDLAGCRNGLRETFRFSRTVEHKVSTVPLQQEDCYLLGCVNANVVSRPKKVVIHLCGICDTMSRAGEILIVNKEKKLHTVIKNWKRDQRSRGIFILKDTENLPGEGPEQPDLTAKQILSASRDGTSRSPL